MPIPDYLYRREAIKISKISNEENQKRLDLYNEGKNDYQIASECNVTNGSILHWRKTKNLPAHGKL